MNQFGQQINVNIIYLCTIVELNQICRNPLIVIEKLYGLRNIFLVDLKLVACLQYTMKALSKIKKSEQLSPRVINVNNSSGNDMEIRLEKEGLHGLRYMSESYLRDRTSYAMTFPMGS